MDMDIQINKLEKHNVSDFQKRGIYYLFDGGELVYIGQSINIYSRVMVHLGDKKFDSFSFKEIEDGIGLDDIEMSEILRYKPKYNKFMYEENSQNRLKCIFNLFRRMGYKLPNINRNIYSMNREELVEYLKDRVNMDISDIRHIVNLKTTELNILRNKVGPIM